MNLPATLTPGVAAPGRDEDEMTFRPSPKPTVGVELELQILDRDSGDLAPGAVPLLKACHEEGLACVSAELMQSMIEIKTGVCHQVSELRNELVPCLRRVRNLASSLGYDLAMAGTHPFNRNLQSVVFPDERYERIMERLAWLTYQRLVFGLHVHVGVPSGDMAIGVTNMLVQYLPHLLAVSANSPFWQGVDTGLKSCRSALYGLLPHAGVPRHFSTWKEFQNFCMIMKECDAFQSFKDIYWDIRPRPDFGTIEIRICDMPPNLATTLGLVTLIRSLVISNLRLLSDQPHLCQGDMRLHLIAVENKWLATRYGLAGTFIGSPGGKKRQLGQEVDELINCLMPIARETGDHPFLAALQPMDKFESGAARQRRIYRGAGTWQAVIHDLKARFAEGLILPTGPTVLLVEDNQDSREGLARHLQRKGYKTLIAVDGREGVDVASAETPDIILMDMSLPILDGWEATRRLKTTPLTQAIPVIALTAHAMAGDREKGLEAGCDDYETKPVEFARLLAKIHSLLDKSPC
jgi:glutamate---cysteine ligase / carboxylate-amine ligase